MAKNPVTHQKGSNRKVGKRILSRWQLYLLLLLPVLWLIIFAYVPMSGLVLAFKKYNAGLGVWGSPWAGLDNFSKFFNSFKFPIVMKNTLTISLYSLAVSFPIPIIFALLLNAMLGQNIRR